MNLFHTVRDILVGRSRIESRLEYKSAMLRGYMALLAFFVGAAYIFIDLISQIYINFPYYVAVIVLAVITIALNRSHYFRSATVLFLLTINLIIFLFASSDLYRTGTYMFFICISLSAFSLFGFKQIQYAVLFSMLSLALFLISYLGEYSIIQVKEYSETYITITFVANFLIALLTSVLIVYFLINIHHHSEQDLIQTTKELDLSRERNQMVVEAVDAGVYEWKPIEQTIFVSPAWKKLLGYGEHELKDFTVEFYYSILHPDDHEHTLENIKRHLIEKKPYYHEVRLRTKSGEYVWFMDSASTKFDALGRPVVTVGSIININKRKQTEEKILRQNDLLAKANKELDQFVYSVSHDLRAPLSSILGLTNVYNLTDQQKEKESIVKLIGERTNILDAFIREILAYSRNSRTEIKNQEVNVLQAVNEVLDGLTYMQGFDRIRIVEDIQPELAVTTDKERLKVILSNLIANAVKYSDDRKESIVHIRSFVEGGSLILSIEDNGIGIEKEHHERIFDMFYQAYELATGSGLGLYIVNETLQKLNGRIIMESQYGIGSTFTFSLPVESFVSSQ
jgi:PAS domain S-box-containing protein